MDRRFLFLLPLAALLAVFASGCNKSGSGQSGGGNDCLNEFASGQPTSSQADVRLLCRKEYSSLYDPARKVPLVVGEHLTPAELVKNVSRTDAFQPDPDLAAGERAELNDYQRSGYDRGHMAPAGDFTSDEAVMQQSFYLSNMVPQNGPMNRGIWSGLESATRACAGSLGGLFVLTGPVFEGRTKTIGPDGVAVPSSLYKVVVRGNKARAFLMPNRDLPRTGNFLRYEVTVDEVQRATGLMFFPGGEVNTQQRGDFCAGYYGS